MKRKVDQHVPAGIEEMDSYKWYLIGLKNECINSSSVKLNAYSMMA